jgi:hypothetical protein
MTAQEDELGFPRHPFLSVHDAATRLREAASRASSEPLFLLPFNRHDPEDTEWWLSPVPDNPAYKYGKVILAPGKLADPGDLLIALSFEKGIGAATSLDAARDQVRVMDRTWAWERRLMRALRSGSLADAALAAEEAAGLPLTVVVDASYHRPRRGWGDMDERGGDWPSDMVRFRCSAGRLTLIDHDLPAALLDGLPGAESFSSIASVLDSMPKADWAWVDFYIGVRFRRAEPSGEPAWSPADVWRKVCAPWAGWVD